MSHDPLSLFSSLKIAREEEYVSIATNVFSVLSTLEGNC